MKYDFKTLRSRTGTGAFKWDAMKEAKPDVSDAAVPFSVADMEFINAPEITSGLKNYIDTSILGYTGPTDAYYEAVINWMRTRHDFTPERKWIMQSPGVVPAFTRMAGAICGVNRDAGKGAVMFLTPAYPPFWDAGRQNGLDTVEIPLLAGADSYEIDFDAFTAAARRPEVKLFILCNPHNPVGRVWSRDELIRMYDICIENGVFVISDEIHSDIIMPGYRHVSAATLGAEYYPYTAICTAPSKTFNLAGLQVSNIIVPDDGVREKLSRAGVFSTVNALGYEACRIAYTECGGWLDELITTIDGNRRYVADFLREELPAVKVYQLQGTYLLWCDFNGLCADTAELERRHVGAELFFDEGYIFGAPGRGFERINLACPRDVLCAAMERLRRCHNV